MGGDTHVQGLEKEEKLLDYWTLVVERYRRISVLELMEEEEEEEVEGVLTNSVPAWCGAPT